MISTPMSCTSDYYSGSDIDYDDDDHYHHVVKAASQDHYSTKETNVILQTLIQYNNDHQQTSCLSSTIHIEQSMRLFKFVKENNLSDEVFIRSNAILHKFLLSTCTNINDHSSILVACLSLATKLCEHSTHLSMTLFNSDTLMLNENLICNTLDWEIDLITPINYVEAILSRLTDCSVKDHLRELSYRLIVLCMTDVRCVSVSTLSVGMCCLLMACELINCGENVPKQVFEFQQDKNNLFEISLIYIRQVLTDILRQ